MDLFDAPKTRALLVGRGDPERARSAWERLGDAAQPPDREAVRLLQRSLAVLGYTTGPGASSGVVIDGRWGPGTTAGLSRFQREHGLPVGTLDRATRLALETGIARRAAAFTPAEAEAMGQVLDRRLNGAAHLGRHHRNALEEAARTARIPASGMYALLMQESNGGADNTPRFEQSVFRPIDAAGRFLSAQATELARLDPNRDSARIDQLHQQARQAAAASGRAEPSDLVALVAGGDRSAAGRLAAMRTIAGFSEGRRRELATSWGYAQVLGYHTLERRWQRATGRTADELLADLQSPDPATQLATAASFLAHGSDSAGRTGGVAAALRQEDWEAVARAHNGRYWQQHNPNYARNLAEHSHAYAERVYAGSPTAVPPANPSMLPANEGYRRLRAQLCTCPAAPVQTFSPRSSVPER